MSRDEEIITLADHVVSFVHACTLVNSEEELRLLIRVIGPMFVVRANDALARLYVSHPAMLPRHVGTVRRHVIQEAQCLIQDRTRDLVHHVSFTMPHDSRNDEVHLRFTFNGWYAAANLSMNELSQRERDEAYVRVAVFAARATVVLLDIEPEG